MPKVFLSPSNQFANRYAAGNTNEGKMMGVVANLLKKALERNGMQVMLMHDQSMADKCKTANSWGADVYIPIHSNACNGSVAGTRMFCWSKPGRGYDLCMDIFRYLAPLTPGTSESIKVDPTLYEVRYPYAPVAYVETDFHDVPEVATWIINHTADIAEAICKGVCDYFAIQYKAPTEPEKVVVELPALRMGDANGYVKTIQILLNERHGASLVVDGDFGSATDREVRKFQTEYQTGVDGVVGKKTWSALLK